MPSDQHSIDKLLAILFAHDESELLSSEVKAAVDVTDVDKVMLKKYTDLVRHIRYAWQKIEKYQKYFDVFYPPEEVISKAECLTHHVHAYLDDLYTISQKLFNLLGTLKNDATTRVENAKEFKVAIDELKEKMLKGSRELDRLRGQHRHSGMRYVHVTLLQAENAEGMIQHIDNPFFSSMYDDETRKALKIKFEEEAKANFEEAKKDWIELARQNSEHFNKNLDDLFDGLAQNIYQMLGITATAKALQELSNWTHEKNNQN